MANHDFGIIDIFDPNIKQYEEYTPQKYGCVSVDDSIIETIIDKLSYIDTYIHTEERPGNGLAYCGITIIPPYSLREFKDIIDAENNFELNELSMKIEEAIVQNKYMIHYGI